MKDIQKQNRYIFLDMLRILAFLLVAYTHLVYCAMNSDTLPNIVIDKTLPILQNNGLDIFEQFLSSYLNTNPASLGVALFFLITGYLMPMMMDRYTRFEFLVNRFLRIFPTMIVATIIIGIFLYYSQNIVFSTSEYINSWFLTSYIAKKQMITGVLWTLVVEVVFYLICFCVGKFNYKKLLFLEFFIIILILCGHWHVWWICKFLICILVGSSLYLTRNESNIYKKYGIFLFSFLLYILSFKLDAHFLKIDSMHHHAATSVIVVLLFIFAQKITEKINLSERIVKIVKNTASLVYPLYLIHCSIGLALLENLRHYIGNNYFMMYLTVITTIFVISFLLHKLVEEPSINLGRIFVKKLGEGNK